MPIPGTVPVSAKLAPTDLLDTYPTHTDDECRGGLRSVADEAARDAIPASRRKAGMAVIVRSLGGKLHVLGDDLTTWTPINI
jgi:hypothetical protein